MYSVIFSDEAKELLKRLKKKDNVFLERINKAIKEIAQNPEHYKPLRNIMKGKRRKHIGHFVLIFSFQNNIVCIESVAHHDNAYD
ncbi:MAG: type II toxin-antitoxin system RelE/ParE family toxin [Nanoarchaeota archaeon]|nr:type II toxin-antitoxin system RelE/ParE family toxin [Nanoarchaeota archaeon]